ncbi:hypothetical protein NY057_05365 [Curtobacterium flaccumfaciens]|uniref:hypothetical protein n=1 Tax=Curtobacterium flaccumfaciens TaxID=2035 RepID=UPI0022014EAC|nr:hypothetical protein [Curtobacterium flaccumfaciens]UWD83675.1 hypothetical protein NY057_05365 [Curtobacterium flaccumfaciens]
MTTKFTRHGATVEQHKKHPDRWFVTIADGQHPVARVEERADGWWAFALWDGSEENGRRVGSAHPSLEDAVDEALEDF